MMNKMIRRRMSGSLLAGLLSIACIMNGAAYASDGWTEEDLLQESLTYDLEAASDTSEEEALDLPEEAVQDSTADASSESAEDVVPNDLSDAEDVVPDGLSDDDFTDEELPEMLVSDDSGSDVSAGQIQPDAIFPGDDSEAEAFVDEGSGLEDADSTDAGSDLRDADGADAGSDPEDADGMAGGSDLSRNSSEESDSTALSEDNSGLSDASDQKPDQTALPEDEWNSSDLTEEGIPGFIIEDENAGEDLETSAQKNSDPDPDGEDAVLLAAGTEEEETLAGDSDPAHFTVKKDGENATVIGYTGPGGTVIVPKTVTIGEDTLDVTSIGSNAFSSSSSSKAITVVRLPITIEKIGNSAFSNCTMLNKVTGVNDGKEIAFTLVPLNEIGSSAFKDCRLLDAFEIPESVKVIGSDAFSGCVGLDRIMIPEGVISLPAKTFYGCTTLANISIPDTLTGIGASAFQGCTNLKGFDGGTTIDLPESLETIGNSAFAGSGIVSASIPKGVTVIPQGLFSGCTNLTSVVLHDEITQIGVSAFSNCKNLATISVPGQKERVACRIPEKVSLIGQSAFYGCESVKSVYIPDGVVAINASTFEKCTALTDVTVNSSTKIESIGDSAFSDCKNLKGFEIPSNVSGIGSYAFKGTSLISATVPSGVRILNNGIFQNCASLQTVSIKGSVSSVFASVFSGCTNLTKVELPDTVVNIEGGTFSGCAKLESVKLPQNNEAFTVLKSSLFSGCSSLKSIKIPAYVKTIEASVFYGCSSLKEVVWEGEALTNIGNNAFQNCSALESSGSNKSFAIPKNTESIGTNAFAGCSSLSVIAIPQSVTALSNGAFSGCTQLGTVTLPADLNISEVSSSLFYNCSSLTNITIPKKIQKIGSNAYYGCKALETVEWAGFSDATFEMIDSLAFYNCSSLGEVEPPHSTKTIKDNAFNGSTVIIKAECGNYVADWAIKVLPRERTKIYGHADASIETLPAEAATCTTAGKTEGKRCKDCGYLVQPQEELAVLGHAMEAHPYTRPTCTEDGNNAYWYCTRCKKYFGKASGGAEIEKDSWVIPAKGHTYGNLVAMKEATCTADGMKAYYRCSACREYFDSEKNPMTAEELVIPKKGHVLKKHAAAAKTCTRDGNSEYYSCSVCGKYFSDAAGTTAISENSWVIKASHEYGSLIARKAASCTADGMEAHYRCSVCHKYFRTDRTQVEKEDLEILSYGGHTWDQGTVTKKATQTKAGVMTFTCTRCGKKKTEKIPASGVLIEEIKKKSSITKVPSIQKPKSAKKGKVKVSWKNFSTKKKAAKEIWKKIQKIEIQYSTKKSFKSSKTKEAARSKKKITLSGLKKGKTYYIRIRYRGRGGICSKWSKVRKVKAK